MRLQDCSQAHLRMSAIGGKAWTSQNVQLMGTGLLSPAFRSDSLVVYRGSSDAVSGLPHCIDGFDQHRPARSALADHAAATAETRRSDRGARASSESGRSKRRAQSDLSEKARGSSGYSQPAATTGYPNAGATIADTG